MKLRMTLLAALAALFAVGIAAAAGTFSYDPPPETFIYDPPPEQVTINGCIDPAPYTTAEGDSLDVGQRCKDFTKSYDPAPRQVAYDPPPRDVTCPDSVCPPVNPPPPPPPPPPANALYSRDWEDGLIPGSSPYGGFDWGCQAAESNPTCNHSVFAGLVRGTISIDSTSAAKGSKSAKFVMPSCSSCSTRAAEMLHTRKPDMNTDDYYSVAIKVLPGFFVPNDQPASMMQPNYQGMSGGAGGVQAQTVPAGSTSGVTSLFMSVCTGNNSAGPCPYFAGAPRGGGYACRGMPSGECGPYYLVAPGTLQTGVWYEFINHVHWSTENDGLVESWRRAPGESTFTKLFSHTGFPTILYGTPGWSKAELNSNTQQTTDKFGLYLGGSTSSVGIAADQFCRATSLDAAKSCLS